jgi:hypothetical protein
MLNSLIGIIASSGGVTSSNSYESIATVTVGGGGSSSISFSSIPSTYQHLQIRFLAQGGAVGLNCQMNGATSNYTSHFMYGDGSTATAQGTTGEAFIPCGRTPTSTYFGAGVIDILDYQNTNKYKTLRSLAGNDQNGSGSMWLFSGLYQSTTAISSLTLFSSSGNLAQYSSFALYGIKG